jgi:hypothetical protein
LVHGLKLHKIYNITTILAASWNGFIQEAMVWSAWENRGSPEYKGIFILNNNQRNKQKAKIIYIFVNETK